MRTQDEIEDLLNIHLAPHGYPMPARQRGRRGPTLQEGWSAFLLPDDSEILIMWSRPSDYDSGPASLEELEQLEAQMAEDQSSEEEIPSKREPEDWLYRYNQLTKIYEILIEQGFKGEIGSGINDTPQITLTHIPERG